MRMPRIYKLNGVEIRSSRCDGFLFTARKDFGDCVACGELVKKGQKRVRMNVFGQDEPMHLKCYLADHSSYSTPTILGVKIEKWYNFGILRTYVICKEFEGEEEKESLKSE